MDEYLALHDAVEKQQQVMWEIARWEQFNQIAISPYIKKANKPKSPAAFVKFPWDVVDHESKEVLTLTEEQVARLNRIMMS